MLLVNARARDERKTPILNATSPLRCIKVKLESKSDLKHLSSAALAIIGRFCPLTSEGVLFKILAISSQYQFWSQFSPHIEMFENSLKSISVHFQYITNLTTKFYFHISILAWKLDPKLVLVPNSVCLIVTSETQTTISHTLSTRAWL